MERPPLSWGVVSSREAICFAIEIWMRITYAVLLSSKTRYAANDSYETVVSKA